MKLLVGILLMLGWLDAFAQTNTLRFRITHIKEVSGCRQGNGLVFEQGYIMAENRSKPVIVMLYMEKNNGAFDMIRKTYPAGTVNVSLNIFNCDYTGNHYAYIKYVDDTDFHFPTSDEIYRRHKEVLETKRPEFVITTQKPNPKCPHVYRIESGFVYSPAGGRVDVKLMLETVTGEWRTINLYRYGTGPILINYGSCDLTGNSKAVASFGYGVTLSDASKD